MKALIPCPPPFHEAKRTDSNLTNLAENIINIAADAEGVYSDEEEGLRRY